jgi:phage tail-like protein
MRGHVDALASPVPIGGLLPSVYQDLDPNVLRLTEAFDAVLAPVFLALDNLEAYFDPDLAPSDFVALLAQWVGLPVDDNWREDQVRRLVADAVGLYHWRGTRRGVVALVEAYTGITPEVLDSGGTIWSASAGTAAPGSPDPGVRIRLSLPPSNSEDLTRLTRLISESVPAHIPVTVEMLLGEAE